MYYNTNSHTECNIKVPCLNCEHRIVGCHTVCTAYTDYKADMAKVYANKVKFEQEAIDYRNARRKQQYGY